MHANRQQLLNVTSRCNVIIKAGVTWVTWTMGSLLTPQNSIKLHAVHAFCCVGRTFDGDMYFS